MKKSYLLVLIIFVICCSRETGKNKSEITINDFPKETVLKGTELEVPAILLHPSKMIISDSIMVISQDRKDSIFSLFKLPDCKYITSFGSLGNGPNEFNLSFANVTMGALNSRNGSFAVGNLMNKIQYYNFNDVINKKYEPYKIESLPVEFNGFRAIGYFSDSIIIGAPYRGGMHLFKYFSESKDFMTYAEYPEKYPMLDVEILREVYGCYMAKKPDNTMFALSYAHEGKIEIYNIKNNKKITLKYEGFPTLAENMNINQTTKYLEHDPDKHIVFCANAVATNKYIYMKTCNEKYSIVYDKHGPKRSFIPNIHVFDWSGNPIAKLKISDFYSYYSVDPNDKYLYAIDEEVENKINRYDLSNAF